MAPSTTKQWSIVGQDGFDSLKFEEKAEIPNLGDHDVLVNFHYASLNYRDLIIPKVRCPLPPYANSALSASPAPELIIIAGQISFPSRPSSSPRL